MKKFISVVALSALGLSGCQMFSAFDSIYTFSSDPVVRAATLSNATKQSVLAAGTKPSKEEPAKNFNGTCIDFVLSKDGKVANYYVAVNEKDQVVASGFFTCAVANSQINGTERAVISGKRAAPGEFDADEARHNLKQIF